MTLSMEKLLSWPNKISVEWRKKDPNNRILKDLFILSEL